MTRCPKNPLRPLLEEEQRQLLHLSRCHAAPARHVACAKAVLAVADGGSYRTAAQAAGRRSGDAVAALVARFTVEGVAAVIPRQGGGRRPGYPAWAREPMLAEARRLPDRERDGPAVGSLTTWRRAWRRNGLPPVSTATIGRVVVDAGLRWQRHRAGCDTGTAQRRRQAGGSDGRGHRARAGCRGAHKLLACAYRDGRRLGLAGWGAAEAGPYPAIPQPRQRGQPAGAPARYPPEDRRGGPAKWLALFHPATGPVRVKGITRCPHTVLPPWRQAELAALVAGLPPREQPPAAAANRAAGTRWQDG